MYQGSQLPSLAFGRDSKAGRGAGKLYSEKGRRLRVCADRGWFAWRSGRWLSRSEAPYAAGLESVSGFLWLVLT